MIQNPVNNGSQPVVTQPQRKPVYAPSYNAVQINLDTPTLNAPQPGYYYDYPQATGQPYYPPVQQPPIQPQPQAPAAPQPAPTAEQQQPPVVVPPPVVEQPAPTTVAPQPQPQAPAVQPAPATPDAPQAPAVDVEKVVANLASPDFDTQALQMEQIAEKGLKNEADALPYVQEDVFDKLLDIIDVDSSKLAGPTEQQLQLRDKLAENQTAAIEAQNQGKDPSTVKLPHEMTNEEVALASTITPLEQAERNKEYALFTTAILQKTYGDEIEKRTGNVVPLTDLPAAAAVVDELKSNQNPAIRTAAIDALRYIQRPEYKDDLSQIYTIAKTDADDGVVAAATDALNSLNAPQPQAQQA
jgi:hypothetical protein